MKVTNKNGFTLAEVLVTLAIIGVIASMAVPTLLQSTQSAEWKTSWKNDYAILSQAANKLQFDSGEDLTYYTNNIHTFETDLKTYLQYVKEDSGDALYPSALISATYKDSSGALLNGRLMDDGQIILNNGALVMFENYPPYSTPLMIWVDVNGFEKGPNIMGKDLFGAEIVGNKRLLPIGENAVTQISCGCSKTVCNVTNWSGYGTLNLSGAGCSADYLFK